MATLTLANRANLFDVQKQKAPDGGAIEVTNTLVETNDLIKDLPAVPSNGGLFHQGARVTSLPSGSLVNVGGTWSSSKMETQPFVENLATIRSRYQAPKDVLTTEGAAVSAQTVQDNINAHLEGLGQGWTNLILEGPTAPQQNAVVGLMGRAPWKDIDNEYTYDVGGTGNNLRSAWLIKPHRSKVHLIYNPNHPTLGVGHDDKGEVFVQDFGSTSNPASLDAAEGRWDIIHEFMLQEGICIKDQRAVKRIANIPCGPTDSPTAELINNAIRASLKHTVRTGDNTPWFLYCDADVYTQLVLGANDKLKVFMSEANIYQTKLPMIGPDVIIRRMDALNHAADSGETQVT